MPTYEVSAPDGKKYRVNAPEGASQDDAIAYVQKQFYAPTDVDMSAPPKAEPKPEQFGQRVNREISEIPRQLGLTARYGLEGMGSIPAMFGNAMEGAGIKGSGGNAGETVANWLDLPKPQGAVEGAVGEASKMMVPAAGIVKGAGALSQGATGTSKRVLDMLASNPGLQTISAAGAGGAGGYVRETGGGDGAQLLASVAGGFASPLAARGVASLPGKVANSAKSAVEWLAPGLTKPNTTNIDITIQNALKSSGMTLDDIPANILGTLRQDVAAAAKQGDLSPDALQRLIAYRSIGATPLRGNLTLDPVQLTREKNLSKLGANTSDSKLGLLAQRENSNNRLLIDRMNGMGAGTSDDQIAGANKIIDVLHGKDKATRGAVGGLYDAAKSTSGRSANLDPAAFTQRTNNLLDDALLGGKLDDDVRNKLNKIAKGEIPLTVDVAEQFKTKIGDLQRASNDGQARQALSLVRQALDDTPLLEGQGQQAIDAFNAARSAHRAYMQIVEKTPALQAVRDGVEPDKFVNDFIVGNGGKASVASLESLKSAVNSSPQAMQSIREQIMAHIKGKALNGAADEVGGVSQSGLNKAIDQIGERKLSLFFSKDEISQIKNIGKVASYEQVQPKGSAVNNSNTAGATLGQLLESFSRSPILGKIPLGSQIVAEPLRNISAGMNARQATNIPAALVMPKARQPVGGQIFIPGLFAQPDEKRRGLLE